MNTIKNLLKDLGVRFRVQKLALPNTQIIQFDKIVKRDLIISDWIFKNKRLKWCDKPGYNRYEIRYYLDYQLRPEIRNTLTNIFGDKNYQFRDRLSNIQRGEYYGIKNTFYIKDGVNHKEFEREKNKYIGVVKRQLNNIKVKAKIHNEIQHYLERLNDNLKEYNKDNVESNISYAVNNFVLSQMPKLPTMPTEHFKDLIPYIKEYKISLKDMSISLGDVADHLDKYAEGCMQQLITDIKNLTPSTLT